MIEILKNGGRIHLWDEHFQFGLDKARMLLACLDVLHEFHTANDSQRRQFEQQTIRDEETNITITVHVEMRPDFKRSTGETIDRPYLFLQAGDSKNTRLGLGALKCRAVWSVRRQLRDWADSHS